MAQKDYVRKVCVKNSLFKERIDKSIKDGCPMPVALAMVVVELTAGLFRSYADIKAAYDRGDMVCLAIYGDKRDDTDVVCLEYDGKKHNLCTVEFEANTFAEYGATYMDILNAVNFIKETEQVLIGVIENEKVLTV